MADSRSAHLETELIPYLRGELAAGERERIAQHLEGCGECRASTESFGAILAELRRSAPEPPEVDWRRYRGELRTKLEERTTQRSYWALPRLVPLAATAALAALVVVASWQGAPRHEVPGEDLPLFEETAIGSQLELLQNYALLENLDMLEDLEIVEDVDGSGGVAEG